MKSHSYLEENTKYIESSIPSLANFIPDLKENMINFIYLGKQDYLPMWELQKYLHTLRKNRKIPDVVLLLEHKSVYTFGKNADKNYLLDSHLEAEIVQTDRGGEVTYHGLGQLVGYTILNLNEYKKSITWFMRSLESVIINTLKHFKIQGNRKDTLPGVWVEDEKICAMGVRIAQWVTMHGFALNINPNMKYFDGMIPCGILDCGVTSMEIQSNNNIRKKDVINKLIYEFSEIFKK